MQIDFIALVKPALNINNAREYAAQTDKYTWVVYHILDSVDVRATDARVEYVENCFDELLSNA